MKFLKSHEDLKFGHQLGEIMHTSASSPLLVADSTPMPSCAASRCMSDGDVQVFWTQTHLDYCGFAVCRELGTLDHIMATKRNNPIEPKSSDITMDLSEAGTKPCSPGFGDEQSEDQKTDNAFHDSNAYGIHTGTQEQYENGSSVANAASLSDTCGTSELVEELQREHLKR
jgi:hypothetical protein